MPPILLGFQGHRRFKLRFSAEVRVRALCQDPTGSRGKKLNPDDPAGEKFFRSLLDSPLRTVLSITPVKRIMYNARTAGAHMTGRIEEKDLGPRLPSDAVRMNHERARKGLPPR